MSLLKEEVNACKYMIAHFIELLICSVIYSFSFLTLNRKHRVKRSIKVPAISNKLADIPPDEYSWRKYGQKPIKGSPHPRYIGCLLYIEMLLHRTLP